MRYFHEEDERKQQDWNAPERPPTRWSLTSPKGSRGPWPKALRCWHSCLSPSSLPFSFCPQFGGSSCCGRVSAFPKCGFFPTSLPVTCVCRVHPGIALLLESCNRQVTLLIVFCIQYQRCYFSLSTFADIIRSLEDKYSSQMLCGNAWNMRV